MRLVLFKIFGVKIFGYGTMIAIGICAALILVSYRGKKRGYDEDSLLNMSILAIIMGILGGKLLYIITEISSIIEDPSLLMDVGSGFVIYGAITGGALGVYIYCRKKKWVVLKTFDLIVPAVAMAQGFGRIGCFLAGCCYGKPTNMTIGVEFTNSPFAPIGEHLHPTQIYSSVFDFCLAFFLLWYARKERKNGRVFSLYIIIYSIGRFLIEYLRNDPRGSIGPLSTSQFISIFAVIAGLIFFYKGKQSESQNQDLVEEDQNTLEEVEGRSLLTEDESAYKVEEALEAKSNNEARLPEEDTETEHNKQS